MGLLDKVMAMVTPDPGTAPQPEGWAQTRLGHNNAYFLPPDQYGNAVSRYGKGGEQAMTSPPVGIMDRIMGVAYPLPKAIEDSVRQGATVLAPQGASGQDISHEAIHAHSRDAISKIPADQINGLIPAEGQSSLSRFYSPAQMAQEVAARATTEPGSMQLRGKAEGDAVMSHVLNKLGAVDPKKAAELAKYTGVPWGVQ